MKIGLFTSGYQRNPLEHCFEDAKRFGYDFVELWGGRPHAYPYDLANGEIEEVKRLITQDVEQIIISGPRIEEIDKVGKSIFGKVSVIEVPSSVARIGSLILNWKLPIKLTVSHSPPRKMFLW